MLIVRELPFFLKKLRFTAGLGLNIKLILFCYQFIYDGLLSLGRWL